MEENLQLNKCDLITPRDINGLKKEIRDSIALAIEFNDQEDPYQLFHKIQSLPVERRKTILSPYNDFLFAGRLSVNWYKLSVGNLDLFKEKLLLKYPTIFTTSRWADITSSAESITMPEIYGATVDQENNLILRFVYIEKFRPAWRQGAPHRDPIFSEMTVLVNVAENWIEIRGEAKTAEKVAQILVALVNEDSPIISQITLTKKNFSEMNIATIKDNLNGDLLETKGKPKVKHNLNAEQMQSMVKVIRKLDSFLTEIDSPENYTDEIISSLYELRDSISDDGALFELCPPFSGLLLSNLDNVGLSVEEEASYDLSQQALYNSLEDSIDATRCCIRFTTTERGIEKTVTIRLGISTNSLVFLKHINEETISFVRRKFLL